MPKNILSQEMGILYPGRHIVAVQPNGGAPSECYVDEIRNMGGAVSVKHDVKLPASAEGFTFAEQLVIALHALGVKNRHYGRIIDPELREATFPKAIDVARAYQTACDKLDLPEVSGADPHPIQRLFEVGGYVVKTQIKLAAPLSPEACEYVDRLSRGEPTFAVTGTAENRAEADRIRGALAYARTVLEAGRNDKLLTFNAHLAGILPLEIPPPAPPAAY